MKVIFTKTFPINKKIKNNELYISMEYGISCHRCCCGCGDIIYMPFYTNDALTPNDFKKNRWKLINNSGFVSFEGSIGHRPCNSHYFIQNNKYVGYGKYIK